MAAAVLMTAAPLPVAQADPHAWRDKPVGETLAQRFDPPPGYQRSAAKQASFALWLRGLPMKPHGSAIMLHSGQRKFRQDLHVGVIDIDVGKRDLQQCADAIMRLRAEWLWSSGRRNEIAFNFTGGGRVPFSRWVRGDRPNAKGTRWSRRAKRDASYASFKRYMVQVFAYAGTYSLDKELKRVPVADIRIGNVFIKGGFPGHAVLVADMAINPQTNEKRFLLVQSYMPAQDMHILKNPRAADGSPWYSASFDWPLVTPEWTFREGSLKRWP